MKILNPGDEVYYPIISKKIVVLCTILEIDDIYSGGDKMSKCIWVSRDESGVVSATTGTKELDEFGYHISRDVHEEEWSKCTLVNQLLWIDEPVGHAVTLGMDVFLTLAQAKKKIATSTKKKMHRRLRQWRNESTKFIKWTWRHHTDEGPNFPTFPDKKIYVNNC